MMRQSGSRNQRSKGGGFRLKLALQICLLLAICTWLLYQVKHSHDKKKALEDKKLASNEPHLFHFGRKGLPIPNHQNDSMISAAKDDDSEEGEQDRDMKQDEEFKRDPDELDQDRGDDDEEEERGGEEEFFDEEEKDGRAEEDGLFDNKEGEESAQEAREENYKRDDASSAVAHDSAATMEVEDSKANETLGGHVEDPISISNVSNADLAVVNGSHSAEFSDQNELKLNNMTAESSLAIQNGSKFNDSGLGSSGLIPAQDQNNRPEGRDLEDHHPLSSATKKDDEVKDLSAIPVIQNEAKEYDDNKAEE